MSFFSTPAVAPVIAAWPPPSLLRLLDADAASRKATADRIAMMERGLEKERAEMQAEAAELLRQIGHLRSMMGSSEIGLLDIESLVLRLEEAEGRVKRDRRLAKLAQRARREVVRHGRDLAVRFDECMTKFAEFRRFVLSTLRDARWELMAIDAMRHDRIAGQVFDDPQALRRYLNKHAH